MDMVKEDVMTKQRPPWRVRCSLDRLALAKKCRADGWDCKAALRGLSAVRWMVVDFFVFRAKPLETVASPVRYSTVAR